jgi:hypothetical protein
MADQLRYAFPMTSQEFVAKWKRSKLTERSGSHEHFLDLCALLNQPTPAGADPDGTEYTFERGVSKTGGGKGSQAATRARGGTCSETAARTLWSNCGREHGW